MDLAKDVSCHQVLRVVRRPRGTSSGAATATLDAPRHHVVAVDYGAKRNILRSLAGAGCRVTVVPATADAESILAHRPDGIFLSNGPGDPAATGDYAVPVIRSLMESGLPIFGICLGHQLLAHRAGCRDAKDALRSPRRQPPGEGTRDRDGSRSPARTTASRSRQSRCPAGVTATHLSLFDGTLEGLAVDDRPIFSVQYHPEASPGPQDAQHLFARFVALMD